MDMPTCERQGNKQREEERPERQQDLEQVVSEKPREEWSKVLNARESTWTQQQEGQCCIWQEGVDWDDVDSNLIEEWIRVEEVARGSSFG